MNMSDIASESHVLRRLITSAQHSIIIAHTRSNNAKYVGQPSVTPSAPFKGKTSPFCVIPTVICPCIPSPRRLRRPSSPPCNSGGPTLPRLPSRALAVLWSGATPPLTQGGGPPIEGWAIPESLRCVALCPRVLMVQSPLSKATWELHSSACLTQGGPTEAPRTPTVGFTILLWKQRRWDTTPCNFLLCKET